MPPFSSPQGNAPQTLAVLWSLAFIALVFVCLRLYTRYKIVDAIGVDDHLLNIAFVMLIAYCIIITVSAFYGFGLTRDDVPDPWDRSLVIILTGAGQTIIGLAVWISKSSLAFTLLRLFGSCGRKIRWSIIIPPCLLGVFVSSGLLAFWLECRPVSYLWDRLNPDGVCGDTAVYLTLIASVISFFIDFLYAALPWWILKHIQMRPREKRVVLYSLSLGILAGGCGVMRAVTLPSMAEGEYMRDRAALITWHAAELTVTMVCIGIPVCRPLWKDYINKVLPAPSKTETSSLDHFAGQGQLQQFTIGGSDMDGSGRKGSKSSHRSKPSYTGDTYDKVSDVEMGSWNIVTDSEPMAKEEQSRNSWSTYSCSPRARKMFH